VDQQTQNTENRKVKIYILRHGTAEPRTSEVTEASRALTSEGKQELKAVLKLARAAGVAPQLILSSPYKRALETAQMAADALEAPELKQTRALLPDIPPQQIWKEIRSHTGMKQLMVAGHEPHLSRFAAFLLEAPVTIDLKKGGLIRIDVDEADGKPRGVLKWAVTPKLAR
jgi:phosphohistidine phosphatase